MRIKTLHFIFGDQLSHSLSTLRDFDKNEDVVLMCEVTQETTYVWHHVKKLAFIFSAMRHFAEELKEKGFKVEYVKLDDEDNSGSFDSELLRAVEKFKPQNISIVEPSEYRILQKIIRWQKELPTPIVVKFDDRFLCSIANFSKWAKDKKQLRLEFFYRELRKEHNILIESGGKPVGGSWNYDKENRQGYDESLKSPKRISHKKDQITLEVIEMVKKKFSQNFGELEPFHFAINRAQAILELKHFIKEILPFFGEHQDAMATGEAYLYHSLLSCYINIGFLLPLEVCKMAEEAYHQKTAPLNAVEGFIRQILGWREYVRGIYWLFMPNYLESNFFNAKEKLPQFFWNKNTQMFCLREVVNQTIKHAYSHHIQRLMITGNFALLAAINPKETHEWYLAVYADAFESYELPNTLGMALHADGGVMASKPYAASGKYINRMSNFCKSCKFDPEITVGEKACPFNSLYWNFIQKNEAKLKNNQRMKFVYPTWRKMDKGKQQEILKQAEFYLGEIARDVL